MKTPTRSSYSPKKVMLALFLTLVAASPTKAAFGDPANFTAVAREAAVPLKTAVESLKRGRYGEPEHRVAAKALAELEAASVGHAAEDGNLAELRAAVSDARAAEAAFPSETTTLTPKLEAVVSLLDKLFPAASALPAFDSAAGVPRQPQQVLETAGTTAIIERVQKAGATNPARSERFWENSAHRRTDDGAAVATDGSQRRRRIRTTTVAKPDDIAVPGLGQGSDPAAACRGVLADRTFLAGLCGTQPQAALLLAGLMDAVKQQFGTVEGLALVVVFALAGLLLAAASGLGLIAKAVTTLLAAGMMIEGAIPLLKEGYRSFGDWLSSAAGSREHGLALRRVGQAGGAVLLVAAMAVIGGRIGKMPAAKAVAANGEAAYSAIFSKLGLPGGLAAAEAALPVPVKTALVKVFGGPPLTIGTAKGTIPASIVGKRSAELGEFSGRGSAGRAAKLGNDRVVEMASRVIKPEPGYYDVVMHGSANSLGLKRNGKWVRIDHRALARFIQKRHDYDGSAIRLLSCQTGACETGVAKNLANKLGVPVKAPTDMLYVFADGRMRIGAEGAAATGGWKMFTPGKIE